MRNLQSFVFAVFLLASFLGSKYGVAYAQMAANLTGTTTTGPSADSPVSSAALPEDPSAQQSAYATSDNDAEPGVGAGITRPPRPLPRKVTPAREIAIEGFVSYGNWQIFAAGESESLYTAGFEYDRNSWGNFLGAQMDYAAEVLPFVLLRQPRKTDLWGHRRSKDNVLVPGFGFSPIGLRMLWRPNKRFKPYFTVKGGAVGFSQKALSQGASYYAFSLGESIGFYTRLSDRWDMRVGLFGDYHFSNAYITTYNPGLDVMSSSIAFSYHLRGTGTPR